MTSDPIRPFYCGSQFADWEDHSCARCASSGQDYAEDGGEYHWGTCEMEDALTEACIGSGSVEKGLAERHGFWYDENGTWWPPTQCTKWREDRHAR
jgi:hypothetical protein